MKINPFRPNSPVNPGMFVGRIEEIQKLEASLVQTRAGQPTHFMVTGERGIGKTSLLSYVRYLAQGSIPIDDSKMKFLVIDVDVDRYTTQQGLVKRIESALNHELGRSESARKLLADAWGFLTRLEVAGTKLNEKKMEGFEETIVDGFSYSFSEVVARVCSGKEDSAFNAHYDGVIILIDEVDNATPALHLGSFLKLFLERTQKRGCERVVIGLAGLPETRKVLQDSHPSSLRLFEELFLDRLSLRETSAVIDICMRKANETNNETTSISTDARTLLARMSEGYPHFIQQFGYCAFAVDTDGLIERDDVKKGAFGQHGAMELIGNRYYRNDFYNRIQKESYRQVLRIMAEKMDAWVKRSEIQKSFHGNVSTLNNAIKALRDRHIILCKEGEQGVYRLQHKGFALWIKLYADGSTGE